MPVYKKTFTKFAVLGLLMLIVFIFALGKILIDDASDRLTKTHLRRLPETVHTIFDQHPDVAHWFSKPPGTTLPESMAMLSESLLNIPGVFRLKIWDTQGTVIWSDRAELIGKNFAQDHHFQTAASGNVVYNNEGFRKPENQTEQGERVVVEVYMPVYDGNRIIGVFELYESDKELSSLMVSTEKTLWTTLASAGVALYLLMLAVYLLSHDVVAELSQTRMRGLDSQAPPEKE